jgi:protein gp37
MGQNTKIEWADHTWNPVTGCTKVSPGCDHCYIDRCPPFRMAGRKFDGPGVGATTGVVLHPERLDQPLRKRSWRGKRVFVNSLSDVFHEDVPDEYLARMWAVMALSPEVTFLVLTKRHGRMRSLLCSEGFTNRIVRAMLSYVAAHKLNDVAAPVWPLPNVWLGVTVENQAWADNRIPVLLDTPAAVRWLSVEPMLGPVDLALAYQYDPDTFCGGCSGVAGIKHEPACGWEPGEWHGIDWVVVGGESGPGARPMHPDWARSLRDQCAAAGVPFLFKQWGEWAPDERVDSDGARRVGRKPEAKDPKSLVMHPAGMTALTPDNPFDPWERGHPNWHTVMRRVGKHVAGRELDGRTHDEYPIGGDE